MANKDITSKSHLYLRVRQELIQQKTEVGCLHKDLASRGGPDIGGDIKLVDPVT